NGSVTTLTVYAFGLEDHVYSGAGTNQGNTYYYSLAGHLIGALDSSGTTFYLTDALGSILTSFTNASGSAAVKGEQDYAPYGPSRYTQGTINTPKGYTGQYNDSLTGLDYYGARYYDPVVGVFLSADSVQGNPQGMNPYGYEPYTYIPQRSPANQSSR
ncbi:MAG TPA: RHS repeat-associated core domain-containing protein, partial [Ktedonobacteraceae bacterium]|nr:RHS repeat-associated core domain-containing protein [Ktedonobacteraceae bacterium]